MTHLGEYLTSERCRINVEEIQYLLNIFVCFKSIRIWADDFAQKYISSVIRRCFLLFIHCLLLLPCLWRFCCVWSLFCNTVLSVLSSFAIISLRNRGFIDLLYLCSCCQVALSVHCIFLVVSWVSLLSVIIAFPRHAHFPFGIQ